jgi:hypothetical protein
LATCPFTMDIDIEGFIVFTGARKRDARI